MDASKTIKFIVRIAALLLMVLFFVPTVSVSCQGYSTELSAFDAVRGDYGGSNTGASLSGMLGTTTTSMIDGEVSNTAYLLWLLPILALLILICSSSKALLSSIFAAGSAIGMLLFKSGVQKEVNAMMDGMGEYTSYGQQLFTVSGTIWFTIHIVLCIIVIALCMYDKFILNSSIYKASPAGAQPEGSYSDNNTSAGPEEHTIPNDEPIAEKYCSKCGTKYVVGTQYCSVCGNKLD